MVKPIADPKKELSPEDGQIVHEFDEDAERDFVDDDEAWFNGH